MVIVTPFGEIALTTLALLLTLFVLVPVQSFLSFKVKNLFIRLLPLILLSALILVYFVMSIITAGGWDPFYYTTLAFLTGLMLLPCGIVWGVWGVKGVYRQKQS